MPSAGRIEDGRRGHYSQGRASIRKTHVVRRTLSGVLLLLAGVALSLAVGGWWLQRAVFSPEANAGQAEAILNDTEIRRELTAIIADAAAPTLELSANDLAVIIDPIIDSKPGATLMAEIINEAHRRVIGERDDPVSITGVQLIQIVRDERAVDVPGLPIVLPVPKIGTLDVLDTTLRWFVPIMALVGTLILLLALVTRPDRSELVRALGEFGIAIAASLIVFGYIIPVHLVPAIDDSTWIQTSPRLALRSVSFVIGAVVVLAAAGVALIIASSGSGRRKQWSTPLSVGRYREDRSWS